MTDRAPNTSAAQNPGPTVEPVTRPSTTPGRQGAEDTTAERRQKAMDTRAQRHLREIEKNWSAYED